MGEVVEVGKDNKALTVGDRVVVPFTITCGECFFCKRGYYSGCERSNPNLHKVREMWGNSPAGLFGYTHLLGGFSGGQAEYMRVPHADVGPIKVPDGLTDEQVLFLSDIFPTGYMAADFCNIQPDDTIAIWGCGPVGQMAIRSAFLLGAERVIAIDSVPERIALAAAAGALTLNYLDDDIYEQIMELTHGRGADACIDAVGTEPDPATGWDSRLDRIKVATFMGTDRPHVLRQAQAVYNATKAFINSFSFALREELDGTGVTVTCLMPGATETAFFERADMLDTPVGKQKKDDPGFVAQIGYDAIMNGDGDVVSGWKNKLMSAAANVTLRRSWQNNTAKWLPRKKSDAVLRGFYEPPSGLRRKSTEECRRIADLQLR